ncbi:MAG: DUF2065 domain-containing protein [Smithellaceae bacterium]|nr:DUF2065 domain-containing protein [Smithellaceae bacterium]
MDYFLCVLGLVFVLEGLPYFAAPDKLKLYMIKIHELPDSTLRLFGFIAIVTGLFLVYLGRGLN